MNEKSIIKASPQGELKGDQFPHYSTERLNALPIQEAATALGIPTRRQGTALMSHCLWHDDHHPSMQIGGRRNIAHCYSCGHTASVIDLVMEVQHTGFLDACRWLCDAFPGCGAEMICDGWHGAGGNTGRRGAGKDGGWQGAGGNGWRDGGHGGKTASQCKSPISQCKSSISQYKSPMSKCKSPTPISCHLSPSAPLLFTFPREYLETRISSESSFARCLREVFGEERAGLVVTRYRLGAQKAYGRYPDVLFPSIDREGRIRDIKVQGYDCDPRSGRFFHKMDGCTYWLGPVYLKNCHPAATSGVQISAPSIPAPCSEWQLISCQTQPAALSSVPAALTAQPPAPAAQPPASILRCPSAGTHHLPPGTQVSLEIDRQCLFGEHLLRERPNDLVVLVESPKNACVGYAYKPDFVWVAAGNKNMLNRQVLSVLRDRRVIVYPDEDAYEEWRDKLSTMQDIAAFGVFHPPGEGRKRDIADWILGENKLYYENIHNTKIQETNLHDR